MDGVTLDVELREDVIVALERLLAAGSDMVPVMKDIAGHLADTTRDRFETGKGPTGVPWKQSRRARKQNGKTLVDRGDLLGSIREDWGPDYAAAGPEASGGAAIYALIHQLGGTIEHPGGTAYKLDKKRWATFVPNSDAGSDMARTGAHSITIPARPYLGFNDENADYTVAVIADHLATSLKNGAAT